MKQSKSPYPRDMKGYGRAIPDPKWPGSAHIALQFVLNYEEGGESNILHGDPASEAFLSEISGAAAWLGQRHWNMESIYEYGARAGFWRLWRLFTEKKLSLTVFGIATALQRSPDQVQAMREAGWEIASHGLKWIEHKDMPEDTERQSILDAICVHAVTTGERPLGWYTGRCSMNTQKLIMEEGGFLYSSDSYADDLPYLVERPQGGNHLVIPYTLDANDMRFASSQGLHTGDDFFNYLKDTFDCLYEEGRRGSPNMMSVGLHCRLVGRPGRALGLAKFIDYAQSRDKVWIARRIDIARHWQATFPW
jgi:putative urate catabolism protein